MNEIAPARRTSIRITVFVSALLAFSSASFAIEPAKEFLEGLRERQYFDTALEYLDSAKDNPRVAPGFKLTIPYEKGLTLIQFSRVTRDVKEREEKLDEAGELLEDFSEKQRVHPYAPLAKQQLGNLLVERAKINLQRAEGKNLTSEEKDALIAEARTKYDEAISVFQSTWDEMKKRLQGFSKGLDPKNPSHKTLIEARDTFRAGLLQARILIPAIMKEKAETYPDDDDAEKKKLLTEAAKAFADVHEDYRTRIAGLYAQLYEGQCYAILKNEKEALYCFNTLLDQPDGPEFRPLKLKTLVSAAPVWLESDPPKVDVAIEKINKLLVTANRAESQEPDWLFLRLSLARAQKLKAEELEASAERTRTEREARNNAQFVARYKSDYKEDAIELLKTFPDGGNVVIDDDAGPLNFSEARTKGKEALDDMNTAIAAKATPDEIYGHADRAYNLLRKALTMADADTPTEDMNLVRYLLCYLYFFRGDYYDAASMGEFVAMRYPASSGARQCAKIAMASYIKARKDAIDAAKANDRTAEVKFESDKITEICEFITEQWSDQPEAAEAANTLIIFSLQDQDFQQAAKYLEVIPEDSPQRGYSERLIGRQIWTVYLRAINQLERGGASDDVLQAKKSEMADDISDAATLLEQGLQRLGPQPQVTQPVAAAALTLAQIYVDRGQTDKAIALLENNQMGPLALVQQKHPATTENAGYNIETYKTALRAYIAALSGGDQAKRDEAKDKAKKVIDSLKVAMGSTPADKERLVTTFMVMANKLKGQMDSLTDVNEKKAFADGLSSFLDELSGGSSELNIRTWVADTFSKLGETFSEDPTTAKRYYERSIEAFTALLKDPALTDETQLQIEMRLGDTKALLKDYEGALEQYAKVLRKKSSMLNVQVAAAMAYQKWGEATFKTPKTAKDKFVKAMVGGYPDDRAKIDGKKNSNYKRNIIWGWGRLFQVTMKYPQFRNTFYEARYNLALCRFRLATLEDSDKYRNMAKNDILSTMRVAKDLGGPDWWKKFNGLMIEIQRSLGESPAGLPKPSISQTSSSQPSS